MKILEAIKEAFELKSIDNPQLKKLLSEKRKEIGDDIKFCKIMDYWFACRSYNQYLDYSLLAIKISRRLRKRDFDYSLKKSNKNFEFVTEGIVLNLLFDDRHDAYQNAFYSLNELLDVDYELAEKLAGDFIDCFNIKGDIIIDPSVNFVIEEE